MSCCADSGGNASARQRSARRIETSIYAFLGGLSAYASARQRSARRIETIASLPNGGAMTELQRDSDPHGGLKQSRWHRAVCLRLLQRDSDPHGGLKLACNAAAHRGPKLQRDSDPHGGLKPVVRRRGAGDAPSSARQRSARRIETTSDVHLTTYPSTFSETAIRTAD